MTLNPHANTFSGSAQAMVLAAGRGERMRPLTDAFPKPLLQVRGHPLLWYPLQALAQAGVTATVINTGWLGDQIEPAFGSYLDSYSSAFAPVATTASTHPMRLLYSHEGRGAGEALETAGGIMRALPVLDEVFWVAAGDVYVPDFVFSMEVYDNFKASNALAHIWLVPNPEHNQKGDFGLSAEGLALNFSGSLYTFSTIALYKRAFFEADWCPIPPGNPDSVKAPLAPMLRAAMEHRLVSASIYEGLWVDVGTPERLAQLNV